MTVRQYGIEVEFSTSENPEKKDRDVFDAVFRWVLTLRRRVTRKPNG